MNIETAAAIAEERRTSTESEKIEAYQVLVDSGLAWQMAGRIGQTARLMINNGLISSGKYRPLIEDIMEDANNEG